MPQKRNLQAEQQALKDSVSKFQGYEQDPDIKAALQREINRKAYGSSRPVYEQDFNLPRLRQEADRPGVSNVVTQLQDSAKKRSDAQEASFANAFQDIKDPRFRESAIANARAQTKEKFGGLSERAANLYGLQKQESLERLGRAEDRYNQETLKQETLAEPEDRMDRELALLRATENSIAGLTGKKRSGGGRRSGGSKKSGKVARVVNESGGFSFFDEGGVPITAAEYAAIKGKDITTVLKGSMDIGDQEFAGDFFALRSGVKDGEIDVQQAQAALEESYPHIYSQQQAAPAPQEQQQQAAAPQQQGNGRIGSASLFGL